VLPGLIDNHSHRLANAYWNGGLENLKRATEDMAADGYTTVHELYGDGGFIEAARHLAESNELAIRINFYIPYTTAGGELVDSWQTYSYTEKKDTTLRVVGAKIFADGGSVGAAALTTLYQGGSAQGTHGDIFMSQTEMNVAVNNVLTAGYPLAMHVLGDSGVVIGLNAFEDAFDGKGNELRSRMEHCRVMREDLVDQMADLGVVASIQYTWANSGSAYRWETLFLPIVLDWVYPWRRMFDEGIPIAGGNDYPYCSHTQAMQTISYLATRKSQEMDVLPNWMQGDELTVEEGIRGMTVTNAWVVFEDSVKGTIIPGKLADLTILSDDPLTTDPYEVRNITIEMTIMDGIIRHNQMGIQHIAVHDGGTFKMGIDDRGLWGQARIQSGLIYQSRDHLWQGSVMISYDENTIATAVQQSDFITSTNGWVDFDEPGSIALEEATVIYEDVVDWHPGKIQISQKTYMWTGEPFLLVKYYFKNIGLNDLYDLYFGQFMDFDVVDYRTNMGGWGTVNGSGFSYMYNGNDANTPYVGMAMFDNAGNTVNTSSTMIQGYNLKNDNESQISNFMRNGIIEPNTTALAEYAMLMAAGPYDLEADSSISPFYIAFAVGDSYEDLKDGVRSAIDQTALLTNVSQVSPVYPAKFILHQNYPNPANPITTIEYDIPKSAQIIITIQNLRGALVKRYIPGSLPAGTHSIQWDGRNELGISASSGVYVYRIEAKTTERTYIEVKKMIIMK
jgi:hypothetical protein